MTGLLHSLINFLHGILLAYFNDRLQLDFSPQTSCNKGEYVIVCGETYCYSYLSWGHRTVHYSYLTKKNLKLFNTKYFVTKKYFLNVENVIKSCRSMQRIYTFILFS